MPWQADGAPLRLETRELGKEKAKPKSKPMPGQQGARVGGVRGKVVI